LIIDINFVTFLLELCKYLEKVI